LRTQNEYYKPERYQHDITSTISIKKQPELLKHRIRKDTELDDETFRIGVEIEGCFIDDKGRPVDAKPLIRELAGTRAELDLEYA
jgi:hypothetical protein